MDTVTLQFQNIVDFLDYQGVVKTTIELTNYSYYTMSGKFTAEEIEVALSAFNASIVGLLQN